MGWNLLVKLISGSLMTECQTNRLCCSCCCVVLFPCAVATISSIGLILCLLLQLSIGQQQQKYFCVETMFFHPFREVSQTVSTWFLVQKPTKEIWSRKPPKTEKTIDVKKTCAKSVRGLFLYDRECPRTECSCTIENAQEHNFENRYRRQTDHI